MLLKPHRLTGSAGFEVVSPSSALGHVFPHRVRNGVAAVEALGHRVTLGELSRSGGGQTASASHRAREFMTAIRRETSDVIVPTIGGVSAAEEMIPYLDFPEIGAQRKIIIGYSDITSVLLAIQNHVQLVTFYGPLLMTQFAEYPCMHPYTLEGMRKAIWQADPIGRVVPSSEWTDEILGWNDASDMTDGPRKMKRNPGHAAVQEGNASGRLLGGCLQVLVGMLDEAEDHLPSFDGALFFWESSESAPGVAIDPKEIADDLARLLSSGRFDRIRGMIIGRSAHLDSEGHREVAGSVRRLLEESSLDIPAAYGFDFGHTDPMMTIPMGVQASLDVGEVVEFVIRESGVAERLAVHPDPRSPGRGTPFR